MFQKNYGSFWGNRQSQSSFIINWVKKLLRDRAGSLPKGCSDMEENFFIDLSIMPFP